MNISSVGAPILPGQANISFIKSKPRLQESKNGYVDSFEKGLVSGGSVPDLKTVLKLTKSETAFHFPSDASSLRKMASLAGQPLSETEVKAAIKHLKEIKEEVKSSSLSKNEPKVQWLNLAEDAVQSAADAIKAESRKIAFEKVQESYGKEIPDVYETYFKGSKISANEMNQILAVRDDLSSADSKMKTTGNYVEPLIRGDIWDTKINLVRKAAEHPTRDGKPVEINALYYEMASDEMISGLSDAASAGAKVKVILDPGTVQNNGNGVYDATSVAVRLASVEKLLSGQKSENMAVGFYPLQDSLGGSGEIMHRKLLRVGEDVVFGGMNANHGSHENIDFAIKINGPAAKELGELFADDAGYSAGKSKDEVYGNRLNSISDPDKKIVLSKWGFNSMVYAAFADKAGLTGEESEEERTFKIVNAASKDGVNLASIAELEDFDGSGVKDNADALEYLLGSGSSDVSLTSEGRKMLLDLVDGAFDKINSRDNVKHLKNASPPAGETPAGGEASSNVVAVASEGFERQGLLLDAIDEAEDYIKVSAFVMTKNIAEVLAAKKSEFEKQGKKIDIEVILDPGLYTYGGTPNEAGYKILEDAGIDVKWSVLERTSNDHDRKNHSKTIITDKAMLTGSANFSSKGLRDNWEASNIVYFDEDSPASLEMRKNVVEDFDRMYEREALGVDTRKAADEEYRSYNGADKAVLKEKYRDRAIRDFCRQIENYERQSASYISDDSRLNISSGDEGYEILDKLDDSYVDNMRKELSSWHLLKDMSS